MRRWMLVLVAGSLVFAGCGDDTTVTTDGPGAAGSAPGGGDTTRYRGTVTVLESPDHGPELCGAVAESYPPQCGGPAVIGWDWDDVDGEEFAQGTRWGTFEVTGTWDGDALTLTETPRAAAPSGDPRDGPQGPEPTTPCPEPAEGWGPLDPATTTREAQEEAGEVARSLATFAGLWVDQSINPALDDGIDGLEDERAANDPARLVLNVAVTEDPEGAEAAIRDVWGGALCVTEVDHTLAEQSAIQDELVDEYGDRHIASGVDVRANRVTLTVFVATDELRAELEDRYGDAVEVTALLEPATE